MKSCKNWIIKEKNFGFKWEDWILYEVVHNLWGNRQKLVGIDKMYIIWITNSNIRKTMRNYLNDHRKWFSPK